MRCRVVAMIWPVKAGQPFFQGVNSGTDARCLSDPAGQTASRAEDFVTTGRRPGAVKVARIMNYKDNIGRLIHP